jgi:hypothetical protein
MTLVQTVSAVLLVACVLIAYWTTFESIHAPRQPDPARQSEAEPDLAGQIEAVQAGESHTIEMRTPVTADDLSLLTEVNGLKRLRLHQGLVGDDAAESLSRLSQLEVLLLRHCPIGDEAMEAIAQLPSLRDLNVPHGQFTDRGLQAEGPVRTAHRSDDVLF